MCFLIINWAGINIQNVWETICCVYFLWYWNGNYTPYYLILLSFFGLNLVLNIVFGHKIMKFDHFSLFWDQKTVFYRQKYQKSKILSVEILLRRICQKSMSNDACNFVISYIVHIELSRRRIFCLRCKIRRLSMKILK